MFYIYSFKSGQKKEIYNKDVIDEIRNELTCLGNKCKFYTTSPYFGAATTIGDVVNKLYFL